MRVRLAWLLWNSRCADCLTVDPLASSPILLRRRVRSAAAEVCGFLNVHPVR